MERLDKVVAVGCGFSRADARKTVLKGQVTVNGVTVRDISYKVDPTASIVVVNGVTIGYKDKVYLIMNKPKGVLSATEDKSKQTVIDLIPNDLARKDLFPVGRLDKETTGLLIITNDGDFAHSLLSPKKKVPKEYLAVLDAEVTEEVIKGFKNGVTLADGTKLSSAGLEVLENPFTAKVTITEGKYHQIKRMFGVFDIGVNELKRISFAGLKLPKDVLEGQVRELTEQEVLCIKDTKILTK